MHRPGWWTAVARPWMPGIALGAALAWTMPALAQATRADEPRSFLDNVRFDELLRQNHFSHWSFLLLMVLVGLAAGKVASWLLCRLGKRLDGRAWHAQARIFWDATGPAALALFALGLSIGLAQILMTAYLQDFCRRMLVLLYTVAGFWYAFNLVSVLEVALRRITQRTETTLDDELVPIIRKAVRVFVVIIAVLFIVQNIFERDVAAWLTGLGIVGLAVSLAAQDSLKNLFGSFTILFDRPFALGQRIKYRGYDGVVEAIGFRSTRIRTGDGYQVTIPNSAIVNEAVENVALRPSIFRTFSLSIAGDTPADKLRQAVQIVRDLLASEVFAVPIHDPVNHVDPPRVFFAEFAADSYTIKVWYWYRPANWWAYMDHGEKLNLAILEAFERAGIEMAYPTRTVYLAADPRRPLHLPMPDGQDGQNRPGSEEVRHRGSQETGREQPPVHERHVDDRLPR